MSFYTISDFSSTLLSDLPAYGSGQDAGHPPPDPNGPYTVEGNDLVCQAIRSAIVRPPSSSAASSDTSASPPATDPLVPEGPLSLTPVSDLLYVEVPQPRKILKLSLQQRQVIVYVVDYFRLYKSGVEGTRLWHDIAHILTPQINGIYLRNRVQHWFKEKHFNRCYTRLQTLVNRKGRIHNSHIQASLHLAVWHIVQQHWSKREAFITEIARLFKTLIQAGS